MRFVIRVLVAAAGLWLASRIVPGIYVRDGGTLAAAAVLLGVVNAVVRPLVILLTLPFTILTMGLFLFVVNAAMLALVAFFLPGFTIHGFWSAVLGAAVVSLVSWVESQLEPRYTPPPQEYRSRR
jgi:putative membrane protein